jgi:hypothetical protein
MSSSLTRKERILAKMAELRIKKEEAWIEAKARRRLAKEELARRVAVEEARRKEALYQFNWVPPTNPLRVKCWQFEGVAYFRDGHNNVWSVGENKTSIYEGVFVTGSLKRPYIDRRKGPITEEQARERHRWSDEHGHEILWLGNPRL